MKRTILKQACFSTLLFLLIFSCGKTNFPTVYSKTEGLPKHPRGLFVKSKDHWVVSGHDGLFEIHYKDYIVVDSISGLEDIRDVEILEDSSIVFMNSGNKGQIWRYFPSNDSLALVFNRDSVFLDGMSFWNNQFGIAFGDPVNGRLTILRTMDSSQTWHSLDYNLVPVALAGEAGFAASGTGIATLGKSKVIIGTGASVISRLYISNDMGLNWEVKETPIKSGDSYGIYGIYFWSENEGIIIGGSYLYPEDKDSICFRTLDGGETWDETTKGLGGYCSGIHGNKDGSLIIATGRTGTFYSKDKGQNWLLLSTDKFYSVRVLDDRAYFSGKNGEVKVVDIQSITID